MRERWLRRRKGKMIYRPSGRDTHKTNRYTEGQTNRLMVKQVGRQIDLHFLISNLSVKDALHVDAKLGIQVCHQRCTIVNNLGNINISIIFK